MTTIVAASIAFLAPSRASIPPQREYDIRTYGAVGDGKTVNTEAIQRAIDDCSKKGGGTVVISQGRYVTGTIRLKNNVVVRVDAGAVLLGSTNIADYPADTGRNQYVGEPHMDRCLIFARGAKNIGLTGFGTIDGQGASFPNQGDPSQHRPMLIRVIECSGIRVRDLQLRNPASWTSAWLYSEDIVVDGVTVDSRANSNGDGLDFDGCQRVRVSNCSFNTSDDSICLQTSNPKFPCRDIVINNCTMQSKWAAVRIGLLSAGIFENVVVSNCVFRDITDAGFKIQMCEGGTMRNMVFTGIVMQNVPRPLFLTLSRHRRAVNLPEEIPPGGKIENLHFSHFRIDNSQISDTRSGFFISGLPDFPIENISLSDISFTGAGGGTMEQGRLRALPEFTNEVTKGIQPEFFHVGENWPYSSLFARHVRGLWLHNIRFEVARPDARPAIVFEDVVGASLESVSVPGGAEGESAMRFQNARNVTLDLCRGAARSRSFVRVEGSRTEAVELGSGNRTNADEDFSVGPDVPPNATRKTQ